MCLNLSTGHMAATQAFIMAPDEASSTRAENASTWNLLYSNLELGLRINIHLIHLRPGTSNLTRPLGLCTVGQGQYKCSIAVWREPNHWQMVAYRKSLTSWSCMSTWRAVVVKRRNSRTKVNVGRIKEFWADPGRRGLLMQSPPDHPGRHSAQKLPLTKKSSLRPHVPLLHRLQLSNTLQPARQRE